MASLNKVFLMGNLTRDPELRYTTSGTGVCDLGLAVNRRYLVNGEEREEVCFVDIAVFGRQAETCNQVSDGHERNQYAGDMRDAFDASKDYCCHQNGKHQARGQWRDVERGLQHLGYRIGLHRVGDPEASQSTEHGKQEGQPVPMLWPKA